MRRVLPLLLAGCLQAPPDISVHPAPDVVDGSVAAVQPAVADLAAAVDLGVAADLAVADLARPRLPLGALCLASATPASATDDCAPGSGCVANGTVSYCEQDCSVDSDCTQAPIAGGLRPVCEKACTLSCNPAGAADGTQGCPSGTVCSYFLHSVAGTVGEAGDCIVAGPGGEGSACNDDASVCAAGLACIVPLSGASTCRRVCRLGSAAGCKTGQSCQAAFPAAVLASPVFGICT
jgi:hypothetical protein